MVIIAMANSKGGSGKTANTFNLSFELCRRGKKVLLVDMDPQATLTNSFKKEFPQEQLYSEDILATEKLDPSRAPVEVGEGLFLIPATAALGGLESVLMQSMHHTLTLKRQIARFANQSFDYVIIDPPGATDIFMSASLAAADEVVIPVRPTDSDFRTLVDFRKSIEQIQEHYNPKLLVRGVLFNQVMTSSKNVDIYRGFLEGDEWAALVCKTTIRMATGVANAPGHGKDVVSFDPKSKAADDYRKFATEVLSWHQ